MVHLIHGDTQEVLSNWPTHRPKGVMRADAMVSDPPYAVSLDGKSSEDRTAWDSWRTPDDFQKWMAKWSRWLVTDVLRPGAWALAFSGEQTFDLTQRGIRDAGLDIIGMGVWLYATGQVKNKNSNRPAIEPITFARTPPDKPVTALFKEKGIGLLHTAELAKEDGRHPSNVFTDEDVAISEELANVPPFFYCVKPSVKERDYGCDDLPLREKEGGLSGNALGGGPAAMARNIHPTVKPIALMRRLIRLTTRPGAWIIDPFMGSGTTGIAAVLEGRNFIGIEREADFFEISTHRIARAEQDARPA